MNKFIFTAAILTSIISCSNGWSEKEKSAFVSNCMAREIVNERTVKQDSIICNCLLQKTMAKYPRAKDTVNMSYQEAIEWGAKCQGYE